MTSVATSASSTRSDDQSAILRGLGLCTIAMVLLPGQDIIAKYISGTVSAGTLSWFRFLLQSLFTLPFILYFQGVRGLIPNRLWMNVLRGALVAISSTLFFASIKVMPVADAVAIFFIEPFILTILSAVVDKEHVGWRRWTAVAIGFVGVLIVVQPSWAVFGPISTIPAVGGAFFAVYVLLNRRMTAFDTPLTMQFTAGLTALFVMTICLAAGWTFDLPGLTPSVVGARELWFLLLMGVFGTTGHLLFVQASRLAPSSLIAPMQYVEIVGAAILGYLVFGDFPTLGKWVGIFIICGSGAYVFWRESRVQ
jgi:drug/metabolite transporter (DMT)-like permease